MHEVEDPAWLTTREVARRHAPLNTLYFWAHKGEGPIGAKLGQRTLYRRADVETWESAQPRGENPAQSSPNSAMRGR